MELTLHFDGACEPNPGGIATFGWTIEAGSLRFTDSGLVCRGTQATNNVAEYVALGKALRFLADRKADSGPFIDPDDVLHIRGDSMLVICQLTGAWQCNREHLDRLRSRCLELLAQLGCQWDALHVGRDHNCAADELSTQAWIKETGKPFPVRRSRKAAKR